MAKNYVERSRMEQVRQLGNVTVLHCDFVCNFGFLCRALRNIQHRGRGIQQRDVNAKSYQAQGSRSRAAPEIEYTQRRAGQRGQKILQVGEGQVGAQPALWSLEVGRILVRAALEAFSVGFGSRFHAPFVRAARSELTLNFGGVWSRRSGMSTLSLYWSRRVLAPVSSATGKLSDWVIWDRSR